jgi:hypothetical protein
MDNHAETIERLVEMVHTCVPAENLGQAIVPAVACLVGGLFLMYWGAKAIRTLIVIGCLTGGGYVGWVVAQQFGKPPTLGILAGATVLGLTGMFLARFFIACLSGVLAATVALSVFGYYNDLPGRLERFAGTYRQPAPTADNAFPLGEPGSAAKSADKPPLDVVLGFVDHLKKKDEATLRNLIFWMGGAGLIGTLIGLIAYRWSMIVWTSLAGLVLIAGSAAILLANPWPHWHEVAAQNARTVGVVMGVMWLSGMMVQWRGTRRRVAPANAAAEAIASAAKAT